MIEKDGSIEDIGGGSNAAETLLRTFLRSGFAKSYTHSVANLRPSGNIRRTRELATFTIVSGTREKLPSENSSTRPNFSTSQATTPIVASSLSMVKRKVAALEKVDANL